MTTPKANHNYLKIYAIVQIIPLLGVLYLLLALGRGDKSPTSSAILTGLFVPFVLGMMLTTNLIVTPFVWHYKGVKQAAPMIVGGLVIVLYFILMVNNPFR
jgi:hypothetical protein